MNTIFSYFSGAFQEIKKVSWPTEKDAMHITMISIILVVSSSILFAIVDMGFSNILFYALEGLKSLKDTIAI